MSARESSGQSRIKQQRIAWEASLTLTNLKPGDARAALQKALFNSVSLLEYAAREGVELDPIDTQLIVEAVHDRAISDDRNVGSILAAITRVSARTHPVTAETLWATEHDAKPTIKGYRKLAIRLAAIILPLSMISFIYTGISTSISTNLATANEQIVQLHQQLDTLSSQQGVGAPVPPLALSGLQQFAATMRAIYNRAAQLNYFVLRMVDNPLKELCPSDKYPKCKVPQDLMELNPSGDLSGDSVKNELGEKTAIYQKVRLFATSVQEAAQVYWGAVNSCFLPVLYALLGACAYVLRTFTEQTKAKTFAHYVATPARFIIAGIGGGVVGLFNGFSQGTSLPPLGIAFIVGYAADVFFSFLEGAVPHVAKGTAPSLPISQRLGAGAKHDLSGQRGGRQHEPRKPGRSPSPAGGEALSPAEARRAARPPDVLPAPSLTTQPGNEGQVVASHKRPRSG
jgi:hypothetical protein